MRETKKTAKDKISSGRSVCRCRRKGGEEGEIKLQKGYYQQKIQGQLKVMLFFPVFRSRSRSRPEPPFLAGAGAGAEKLRSFGSGSIIKEDE